MNKDVERLDPALREVAARLKAAPQARVSPGFAQGVMAAVHSERVTARAGFFRRLNAPAIFAAATTSSWVAPGRPKAIFSSMVPSSTQLS